MGSVVPLTDILGRLPISKPSQTKGRSRMRGSRNPTGLASNRGPVSHGAAEYGLDVAPLDL
jgi:hypothetical protein